MAAFAMTDAVITIGGTDRSSFVKQVMVSVEGAELDISSMTSGGWTQVTTGMKSGSIQFTFNDSVSSGEIDSVLWNALWTTVAFTVKATSGATGPSNPVYSGSMLVKEWNIGGSVGDLAEKSLTFPLSGALTRATA